MQLADVLENIEQFVHIKGWEDLASPRPQTPRNLATSVSIEAAELLQCFQWSDQVTDAALIEDELADVLIYSLRLAQVLGLDPLEIVQKKLDRNLNRTWEKRVSPR